MSAMDASCEASDRLIVRQYAPTRNTKQLDWHLVDVEDSCSLLSVSRVTRGTDVQFKFNGLSQGAVIILTRVANGPEREIGVRTNLLPANSTLDRAGVLRVSATLPNNSSATFSFQKL